VRVEALQETGQTFFPPNDEYSAMREAVNNGRQGHLDDIFPVVGQQVVSEKDDVEVLRRAPGSLIIGPSKSHV
jgi:hypothetical protein